jgi:hypothetical protein
MNWSLFRIVEFGGGTLFITGTATTKTLQVLARNRGNGPANLKASVIYWSDCKPSRPRRRNPSPMTMPIIASTIAVGSGIVCENDWSMTVARAG